MSLSEKVQQLNSEIGSAMEHALDQVRQEVSQWLRSSNEEILDRLAKLKADIPESFVAHDDLAPAVHSAAEELSAQARLDAEQQARQEIQQARQEIEQFRQQAQEQASRQAQRGGAAELVAALSSIDRARSQADILNALLQEAGRHASRAAILLLRAAKSGPGPEPASATPMPPSARSASGFPAKAPGATRSRVRVPPGCRPRTALSCAAGSRLRWPTAASSSP
jgi:hypothetical protein